jgi:hypothetical protein
MNINWRSSRTVFSASCGLLRDHFPVVARFWLIEIALLAVMAWLLVMTTSERLSGFILVFGFVLLFVYRLLVSSSLIILATDRKTRTIKEILRQPVMMKLPAALALAVLVGVAVSVASVAFLVPGLILYILWSMSLPILLVEDTSVREALRRSVELVRGWFWPVFSRFVFGFVLITLLGMLAIIPGVGSLTASILSFVLAPVLVFYYALTYQELVEVKRFQHLQRAQVPLIAKVLLVATALIAGVLFAAVSAIAPSIDTVMRAASDRAPKDPSREYRMEIDSSGEVSLGEPSTLPYIVE